MIYDLGIHPITFDFLMWLMKVEDARIKAKDKKITIEFMFSPEGFRYRTTRDVQLTNDRKLWRLHNLLIPICWRLGSVANVNLLASNARKALLFDMSTNIYQLPIAPLRASPAALACIGSMIPEPYVAITIRDSDVQKPRNSNKAAWKSVAEHLEQKGYRVIVVPDTEAMLQGRPLSWWQDQCPLAALNIDLRLALYEQSQFSLFTSGGPFNLAVFDEEVNYCLFKMECKDINTCYPSYLEKLGMLDGSNRGPYRQHWWKDDTAKNILETIEPYYEIRKVPVSRETMQVQTHFQGQRIVLEEEVKYL